MDEFHTKYRPRIWSDVLGQDAAVRSIRDALKRKASRAFILIGPSGVGKTTIARLIARELCVDPDVAGSGYDELDAATRTGIDDMRELKGKIRLIPLGGSQNRVVCLDEAHAISRQAFNSLLKDVEEPPKGVHWVFCTTEPTKIPQTIRTRCLEYVLHEVPEHKLEELLTYVIEEEELDLPDSFCDLLIEAAKGSPRALLTGLAKVVDCEDEAAAERVLQTISLEGNRDVADFCRALTKGSDWRTMVKILKRMDNPSAEGIRNVVCAWFTKVAMNAKSDREAERMLAVLSAFGTPYPPAGSSIHPVLLSLGELLLSD